VFVGGIGYREQAVAFQAVCGTIVVDQRIHVQAVGAFAYEALQVAVEVVLVAGFGMGVRRSRVAFLIEMCGLGPVALFLAVVGTGDAVHGIVGIAVAVLPGAALGGTVVPGHGRDVAVELGRVGQRRHHLVVGEVHAEEVHRVALVDARQPATDGIAVVFVCLRVCNAHK
jgi:hypothetical protein